MCLQKTLFWTEAILSCTLADWLDPEKLSEHLLLFLLCLLYCALFGWGILSRKGPHLSGRRESCEPDGKTVAVDVVLLDTHCLPAGGGKWHEKAAETLLQPLAISTQKQIMDGDDPLACGSEEQSKDASINYTQSGIFLSWRALLRRPWQLEAPTSASFASQQHLMSLFSLSYIHTQREGRRR